jgi:hypothetical protein
MKGNITLVASWKGEEVVGSGYIPNAKNNTTIKQ